MIFPTSAPYLRLGPAEPLSPVVISVPHAGRYYPHALLASALPSRAALETLEDRYADLLIDRAVEEGAVAIVAQHARAWIDLNRDPRELDPGMLTPAPPAQELLASAKVRSGLGLIPRRLGGGALIQSRPLPLAAAQARLRDTHAPYHRAIEEALLAARRAFGTAILLDCHSMPPLAPNAAGDPARIVIGDLHGHSAAPRFVAAAAEAVRAFDLPQARNAPYAGAYVIRRHGRPARNVHALQLEIDRSLYLDAGGAPGPGVSRIVALVAAVTMALAARVDGTAVPLAAE